MSGPLQFYFAVDSLGDAQLRLITFVIPFYFVRGTEGHNGVKLHLHSFLTSVVCGRVDSLSLRSFYSQVMSPQYHSKRRCMGSEKESSASSGNRTTVSRLSGK